MRIVLASASPRRRALLSALGLSFDIVTSDVEDSPEFVRPEGIAPSALVTVHARAKRDDVVTRLHSPALVIAADTLVFLDDHILGKPSNAQDARDMLRILSGRTHQVITGVAVSDTTTGRHAEGFETTDVTFRPLAPEEIDCFVNAVNPIDRAGAYTVDGPGALLVARYDGCYQNVLGLPIVRLDLLLREIGHDLFGMVDPARCTFL